MKFKLLAQLLAESPETAKKVEDAGWIPVEVSMVRQDREDDPQEFRHEPAVEAKTTLWLAPDKNKVYIRSPFDDEIIGKLVRDANGLAFESGQVLYAITKYDPQDEPTLTAHL